MKDPKKQIKKTEEETAPKAHDNDAYLPSREDEGYIEPEKQDGMQPEDLDSDAENF
ncbi:hypothetical protein GWC95_02110 [Sediminibacterium roseum]|uniref:Uncharacterized protein n=1 Tax=Sediminibacterium roseum TaxID=1978412 RepID=A0ABW9ZNP7_9BACT|nr:hypothetical protein [Sediminibacterium roseum]NCI48701.1 hypothetical protein [Sediminibacterium roseum]